MSQALMNQLTQPTDKKTKASLKLSNQSNVPGSIQLIDQYISISSLIDQIQGACYYSIDEVNTPLKTINTLTIFDYKRRVLLVREGCILRDEDFYCPRLPPKPASSWFGSLLTLNIRPNIKW